MSQKDLRVQVIACGKCAWFIAKGNHNREKVPCSTYRTLLERLWNVMECLEMHVPDRILARF